VFFKQISSLSVTNTTLHEDLQRSKWA